MEVGAAESYGMHRAGPDALAAIDLEAMDEKVARSLELLGALNNRAIKIFLDICSKCGACAQQCHIYLGTGDPKNIPAGRANLLRKAYKRHFTPMGRLFGRLVGAEDLTEELLEDWFRYFYQCTECRRCAVFCPFGIDTSEITSLARQILTSIGVVPKYLAEVVANVRRTGNNVGIPEAAWLNNCAFLEEEIKEETGEEVKIPVNQSADVLYVPPSADLFVNADTMIGVAKVFHAAGESWTMSTYAGEAANFGLFYDDNTMRALNRRVVDEARRLGAKKVVFGECGHGWRVAKIFMPEFTANPGFEILNILEYTADLIRDGKIRVDPAVNGEPVTYHDPCNMARGAGLIEEPREILRAVVEDFREMNPNRERSFCCGGGGGLLTEELMGFRMKVGRPKAESVRATDARVLVAPCAICKAQLSLVMDHYQLEVRVSGVMDLVGKAMVM
jgi:Fe-S oxidoreductase